MGGKIIAISCWDDIDKKPYTYRKADGLDIEQMAGIKDKYGTIDKEKALSLGCELLDGDAWISQDVDILLPCALENQITPEKPQGSAVRSRLYAKAPTAPPLPTVTS